MIRFATDVFQRHIYTRLNNPSRNGKQLRHSWECLWLIQQEEMRTRHFTNGYRKYCLLLPHCVTVMDLSYSEDKKVAYILEQWNISGWLKSEDNSVVHKMATVFHLLPHHCELNPIQHIWGQVKCNLQVGWF
jgi:hypothetical protein